MGIKNAVLIFTVILCGSACYKIDIKRNIRILSRSMRFSLEEALEKSKIGFLKTDKINRYLLKSGAVYIFGNKIDPLIFLMMKIFASLVCMLVILTTGYLWFIFPGLLLGFYIPEMILNFSNRSDNDDMMEDIKSIYDTLRIQTKAGVYITSSLSECYLAVKNRRLKTALLELNSKIIAKNDIETALDEFNLQFENKYIDILCMIIKQSMESGQSVQILSDLSGQMKDMQHAIYLKDKEKLDRKIQILQMLLFIGVLAICIYGLGTEIAGSLADL